MNKGELFVEYVKASFDFEAFKSGLDAFIKRNRLKIAYTKKVSKMWPSCTDVYTFMVIEQKNLLMHTIEIEVEGDSIFESGVRLSTDNYLVCYEIKSLALRELKRDFDYEVRHAEYIDENESFGCGVANCAPFHTLTV